MYFNLKSIFEEIVDRVIVDTQDKFERWRDADITILEFVTTAVLAIVLFFIAIAVGIAIGLPTGIIMVTYYIGLITLLLIFVGGVHALIEWFRNLPK